MGDDEAQVRVLDAAERLFYDHGIQSVGMDRIRDASAVPLKRLYRLYRSKEELVEAVLRRRQAAFMNSLAASLATIDDPRDRILGVFDYLYEWFNEPNFRGCPFVNAFGEMSAASRAVRAVVEEQKLALRAFVADLASAAKAPPAVAEQLFILANGAMVTAAILRSPEQARLARDAASSLLTHATGRAT